MIEEIKKLAFCWSTEIVDASGQVIEKESNTNLIPAAGLDHLIRAPFGDTSPVSNFFLGLFRGNYIPTPATSSADIPNNLVEFVDYSETSRPQWQKKLTGTATYDNLDNKAEFTVTADRTLYGAFLVSEMTKGGNGGLLLSCVRFGSPKQVSEGQTIRLSGGLTYSSTNII